MEGETYLMLLYKSFLARSVENMANQFSYANTRNFFTDANSKGKQKKVVIVRQCLKARQNMQSKAMKEICSISQNADFKCLIDSSSEISFKSRVYKQIGEDRFWEEFDENTQFFTALEGELQRKLKSMAESNPKQK